MTRIYRIIHMVRVLLRWILCLTLVFFFFFCFFFLGPCRSMWPPPTRLEASLTSHTSMKKWGRGKGEGKGVYVSWSYFKPVVMSRTRKSPFFTPKKTRGFLWTMRVLCGNCDDRKHMIMEILMCRGCGCYLLPISFIQKLSILRRTCITNEHWKVNSEMESICIWVWHHWV